MTDTTALSEFREAVAGALEGSTPSPSDSVVLVDVVDAVSPPAYMLVWGTPWLEPSTFCYHLARLDIICIAGRMDPAPGIATIETMIAVAINRLRGAKLPEVIVQAPARFDIGGVAYLAARLTVEAKLSIPQPDAPIEGGALLTVTATLTAAAVVVGAPTIDGAATMTAAAVLTVAGTVVGAPVIDGAATLTAGPTLTAAGTVVAAAWTPANIAGLVAWFDLSDNTKITATAGAVSDVAPSGGTSTAHLVQATSTAQPQAGVDTINGHPVVKFDGVNDYMAAAIGTVAQPFTVLLVTRRTGTEDGVFHTGVATPNGQLWGNNVAWKQYAGAGPATFTPDATPYTVQFREIYNGASSALYRNGVALTPTASADVGTGGQNGLTLGADTGHSGGFWHEGDIAEYVIVPGLLSGPDITAWNAYTLAKWGV